MHARANGLAQRFLLLLGPRRAHPQRGGAVHYVAAARGVDRGDMSLLLSGMERIRKLELCLCAGGARLKRVIC